MHIKDEASGKLVSVLCRPLPHLEATDVGGRTAILWPWGQELGEVTVAKVELLPKLDCLHLDAFGLHDKTRSVFHYARV